MVGHRFWQMLHALLRHVVERFDDIIIGSQGYDSLIGGEGNDMFVIDTKLSKGKNNVDNIMDFEKNADFIYLEGKAKRINIRTDRAGDTLITNGKDLIAVLWDVEANDHELTKITNNEWYIDIY